MSRMKPGLFLFFGIWSAILIAAGLMAFKSVRVLRVDAQWVTQSHEVLETAQTALTSLVDAETGERGYLLTGNPTFLEPYQSALDRLDAETQRLEALVQDNPQQRSRVHGLKELISPKLGSLAQIIAQNGVDPATARRMVTAGLEKHTMDRLRAEFRGFRDEELTLLQEREQADRHAYRIATLAGIIYGMLGLAGFGGLLLQVLRHTRDRANIERFSGGRTACVRRIEPPRRRFAGLDEAGVMAKRYGFSVALSRLSEQEMAGIRGHGSMEIGAGTGGIGAATPLFLIKQAMDLALSIESGPSR